MPYADKDKQRKFQREWQAKRRQEYLAGKSCEECGTTDNLNLHHRDPEEKITHRVWSWTQARREAELEKCIVLCHLCHMRLHKMKHGKMRAYKSGCRCFECCLAKAARRSDAQLKAIISAWHQ